MGRGLSRVARTLRRDRRGAAVIEAAFVLPLIAMMLFGLVSYGSWIALAQGVQQSANEGARAAIAGLSAPERAALARDAALRVMTRSYGVTPQQLAVGVDDDGATVTVAVSYDASTNPLLSMPLIPLPGTLIERRTAIRIVQP